jgi:uncharacterized protein (DUF488 family)
MQTERFETALEKLVELAQKVDEEEAGHSVAMMCAEGNPFRCHRSLVADALEATGVNVVHISGPWRGRPHRVTPFAAVVGTRVTYPQVAGDRA